VVFSRKEVLRTLAERVKSSPIFHHLRLFRPALGDKLACMIKAALHCEQDAEHKISKPQCALNVCTGDREWG
jgi:hypothetical protein